MMEIIAIKTIAAIIILSIYSFLIFDGYFFIIPGREFISNSISISSRITLSLVVSLAERSWFQKELGLSRCISARYWTPKSVLLNVRVPVAFFTSESRSIVALNVIGFVVDLMVKSPVIWTLYNPSLVFPINLDDLILLYLQLCE